MSHRTCLLGLLSHAPFCPQCLVRIPLATDPVTPTPEVEDECALSPYDRHIYVGHLHDRWAKESRGIGFHDTAELHFMAARKHLKCAERHPLPRMVEEGPLPSGWRSPASEWRNEAVAAEKRAKELEEAGDGEGAWKETEKGRVAAYKAARAED